MLIWPSTLRAGLHCYLTNLLCLLVVTNYGQSCQLLLERGASLECKDEEGAIPLHDACAGGMHFSSALSLFCTLCLVYIIDIYFLYRLHRDSSVDSEFCCKY